MRRLLKALATGCKSNVAAACQGMNQDGVSETLERSDSLKIKELHSRLRKSLLTEAVIRGNKDLLASAKDGQVRWRRSKVRFEFRRDWLNCQARIQPNNS